MCIPAFRAFTPLIRRFVTTTSPVHQARQFHQSTARMALNPRFPGHKLNFYSLVLGSRDHGGLYDLAQPLTKRPCDVAPHIKANYPHTLELYLDYVCPFSKKQFMGLYQYLTKHDIPEGVQIIFRHQIQPWHPSSTLVHEAALATATHGGPGNAAWFWAYSYLLFQKQTDFFDVHVVNENRNQTYQKLVNLFGTLFKEGELKREGSQDREDPAGELWEALVVGHEQGKEGSLNIGNKVTDDLKLCVKLGRQTGIHVSPTVLWDGLVENSVSSSFGEKEWIDFFEKHI